MTSTASARERVIEALERGRVRPVPVGAVTQSATTDQMWASAAFWPDAHSDPGLLARLAFAAHESLGFDFVRVPFDQTIEAELLGAGVDLGGLKDSPVVRSHPLAPGDPHPPPPDLHRGRARVVTDAITILRDRAGSRAAVVGGIVGPFTLASQLLGTQVLLVEALLRPDGVRPLLEFASHVGAAYANLQVQAGADAICVEDMASSLDLASPKLHDVLIHSAQRHLIARIEAPVILHVCGSNTKILDRLGKTGAAALSLDAATDLAKAVALRSCAIVGGVPPVRVLFEGNKDSVRAAVHASLEAGVHILAPGCGLPPDTPTENLLEMARAAREWKA